MFPLASRITSGAPAFRPEACNPNSRGHSAATPPVADPINNPRPKALHPPGGNAKLDGMATTFTSILLHTVFSTKNRVHLIAPEIEDRLHRYIGGIVSNHECRQLCVGGTSNHVHMLLSMSKNITIADFMEVVKKESSKWIKRQDRGYRDFYWQEGYGAFSIGQSNVAALKTYIANQKQHHRKMTFEEELVKLLKKYNIPYDERYIFG